MDNQTNTDQFSDMLDSWVRKLLMIMQHNKQAEDEAFFNYQSIKDAIEMLHKGTNIQFIIDIKLKPVLAVMKDYSRILNNKVQLAWMGELSKYNPINATHSAYANLYADMERELNYWK